MLVKNVEKKDSKTASFQVEVDAKEFDAAVDQAFKKNKSGISPASERARLPVPSLRACTAMMFSIRMLSMSSLHRHMSTATTTAA